MTKPSPQLAAAQSADWDICCAHVKELGVDRATVLTLVCEENVITKEGVVCGVFIAILVL